MSESARARLIAARQRLARRVVTVAVIVGLVLVVLFPKGSDASQFGAILLLGALPMAAWVLIWFAKKRAPMTTSLPSFAAGAPFVPHVQATITAVDETGVDSTRPASSVLAGDRYYLLLGSEGFSVRFRARDGEHGRFDAQFLKPDEALPRFVDGTAFRVFDGSKVVAQGAVTGRPR